MNHGREQIMTKAKKEIRQNIVRLCNSIYHKDTKCKFGERCNASHSLSEYWKKRPEDIGNFILNFKCFNFIILKVQTVLFMIYMANVRLVLHVGMLGHIQIQLHLNN